MTVNEAAVHPPWATFKHRLQSNSSFQTSFDGSSQLHHKNPQTLCSLKTQHVTKAMFIKLNRFHFSTFVDDQQYKKRYIESNCLWLAPSKPFQTLFAPFAHLKTNKKSSSHKTSENRQLTAIYVDRMNSRLKSNSQLCLKMPKRMRNEKGGGKERKSLRFSLSFGCACSWNFLVFHQTSAQFTLIFCRVFG
jgi:hypothetical protein